MITTLVTENAWHREPLDQQRQHFRAIAPTIAQKLYDTGTTQLFTALNVGPDAWIAGAALELGIEVHVVSPWAGYGRGLAVFPEYREVMKRASSHEPGSRMQVGAPRNHIEQRRRLAYFRMLESSDAMASVGPAPRLNPQDYRVLREALRRQLETQRIIYEQHSPR